MGVSKRSIAPWLRDAIHEQAKMLDEEIPGWHKMVNPETLKMSDCSLCVLGQTFGLPMEHKLRQVLGDKCPPLMPSQEANPDLAFSRGLAYLAAHKKKSVGFGTIGDCAWVEEIADRVAKDETSA